MAVSVSESEAKASVPETCERYLSGSRTGQIIQAEQNLCRRREEQRDGHTQIGWCVHSCEDTY